MEGIERLEEVIKGAMTESAIKAAGGMKKIIEDGLEGYIKRKIGSDHINGLTISTVDSPDCGPETAIVDNNSTYIVERYLTINEAKAGHLEWCEKAKSITEVEGLGYDFIPGPGVVKLARTKW